MELSEGFEDWFCRYFETYSMLTNVSNQRRIQTDIQMSKANSTAEIGEWDFFLFECGQNFTFSD